VWLLTAAEFHADGCGCCSAGICQALDVGCHVCVGGGGGGIDGSLNEVIYSTDSQCLHLYNFSYTVSNYQFHNMLIKEPFC